MAPVVLAYADVANPDADLASQLEEAFGPAGLGICTVSDVPGFPELRQELLPLAAKFAHLPEAVKRGYEDPGSRFNFGWSQGRETLEGGQPDTRKGSYYANPLTDVPTDDPHLAQRFPCYCRPNLWPSQEVPQLEAAFKALGQLIMQVGLLLAAHCDKYVAGKAGHPARLYHILQQSPCPKGRLLHYFAPDTAAAAGTAAAPSSQQWCGWHYDHGSLTGLTSAMYLDASGQPASCGDPHAGLHIKDRSGNLVQAVIPADHIGFQVGEAMQVHSGGLLRGTPHCVVAPRAELSCGISRNTFAVFMQPKWDCPLDAPGGAQAEDVGIGQWQPGLAFGAFTERTLQEYYSAAD